MRTGEVQISVRIECSSQTRHIVIEDAVLNQNRDIVLRRRSHFRDICILLVICLGPVTVDQYTAAAVVGLGTIEVTDGIDGVQVVGVTTGDLYTVQLHRTGENRGLTFFFEVVLVTHRDWVRQRVSVSSTILNRLRTYDGRVCVNSHHVIHVRKVLTRYGITGENRLALQFPGLYDGVEVVIAHRSIVRSAHTDSVCRRIIEYNLTSGRQVYFHIAYAVVS